jgi:hypothetical protein
MQLSRSRTLEQHHRRSKTSRLYTAGVEVAGAVLAVGLVLVSQLHGPRILVLCSFVAVVGLSGFVGYRVNRTDPHG